jgi:hypothetical protein
MGWNHSRHSYLVDLGTAIEIQQLEVSDLYENTLIDPPFASTRYCEIVIDEERKDGCKNYAFQTICPVHAKRKPDWHILKFRIKRGSWIVTEHLQSQTAQGEIQWIYANDFALLFVSSGGRHDLEMLVSLMTRKLDAIVRSIAAGSRVPSQFESQQEYRAAFDDIFTKGVDGAFHDTVLYHDHAQGFPSGVPAGQNAIPAMVTGHGKVVVSSKQAANMSVDLNHIEDLQDLSWLND